MTTLTVENYLKAILQHELQTGEILMSTGKIAEAMIVSPGTVTSMLKTLSESQLAEYKPYEGAALTESGRKLAMRIVGVDEKGKESDVRPGTKLKVTAAELEFPGSKWNLAFQFQPPQHVTFAGAGMKFSINSFTKDNWQLGFVRPDGFDVWRGKKRQSARVKKQGQC